MKNHNPLFTNPSLPTPFIVESLLPCGVVTLLTAHGGTGKSMLALQLAVCVAMGFPFMNKQTIPSKVLFFSAEDVTKGFSEQNLRFVRQWVSFWIDDSAIWQQAVAKLTLLPWGHNQVIINKCKNMQEGLYYVSNTIEYGWSRSVLTHQIESQLWQREGKALSNFSQSLPAPQSDLALQTLKDPYIFDFLCLAKGYNENELEKSLVDHITQFLLERGASSAYKVMNLRLVFCYVRVVINWWLNTLSAMCINQLGYQSIRLLSRCLKNLNLVCLL